MIRITEHIQKLQLVQLFDLVKGFETADQEPFGVRINYVKLNESFPEFLPDYNFSSIGNSDDLYQFVEYQDQYYSWYSEDNYNHLGNELFCLYPATSKDFEPGKPWTDYPILYDRVEYSEFQNNLVTTSRFYREERVINIENSAVLCDYWNNHWYRSEIYFTFLETNLFMERHQDRNGNNWITIYNVYESEVKETRLDTTFKIESYINAGYQFYDDIELDLITDLDDFDVAYYLIEKVDPLLIEHFSERLRDDSCLVETATAFCDGSFAFASSRLKSDSDFVIHLIKTLPALNVADFYNSLGTEMKDEPKVTISALDKDFYGTWNCLSSEMKNQVEIKKVLDPMLNNDFPQCYLNWFDIRKFSPTIKERVLNALIEQAKEEGLDGAIPFINEYVQSNGILFYFSHQELAEHEIANIPKFFTNIQCVSFDHSGLLALEICCSQAYQVFTFLGTPLFDELMHDVDFHIDGSITVRPCDVQTGWYSRYRIQLPELILLDRVSFDDELLDLPHVGLRDQLVRIDDGKVFENVFNPLSTQNCLEYINNPEKAAKIVWSRPEAFSQLSSETKSNQKVQLALLDGLIAQLDTLSPWLRAYSNISLENIFSQAQLIEFVRRRKLELDVFPPPITFNVLLAFAESGMQLNSTSEIFFDTCSDNQWHDIVQLNGRLIEIVPGHLKSLEMYKLAAKTYFDILSQAPKSLKMDVDFALSIVNEHPHAIRYFEGIKTEHKDLIAAWNAYQEWLVPGDDLPF